LKVAADCEEAMSDGNDTGKTVQKLSGGQRGVSSVLGILLMVAAFFVFYFVQPNKTTTEFSEDGTQKSVTAENRDTTVPFTTLFLAGVVILIFALNGLPLSKVSIGKNSAEVAFGDKQSVADLSASIARLVAGQMKTAGAKPAPAEIAELAASKAIAMMASRDSREKVASVLRERPQGTTTLDAALKNILGQ
jgi:hypothetical protein